MSHRRKEIFKLLYNLVNRSDSDMKDVFSFVEEILCKDPSLIQSYSLCARNNCFQDTLILWLVNRLVRCLGETRHGEAIHLANVKLQRNILTSCLNNRASLFESLVSAYVAAINELCSGLLVVDGTRLMIDVYAFNSEEEECLKEFDPQFGFKTIQVPIKNVDERVQALLNILQHAVNIGYDVYPSLFNDSLQCVLHAFKECLLSTKLTCFRYCNSILKRVLNNGKFVPLDSFFKLFLNALSLLWSQLPIWQSAGFLRSPDIKRLVDVSADILVTEHCYIEQLPKYLHDRNMHMFELAYIMLENAANVSVSEQPEVIKPLIDCLVDFILSLKWNLHHELIARDIQKVELIIRFCPRYPRIVRVLAASAIPALNTSDLIHNFLIKNLCELLNEANMSQIILLYEIITALMFIDHAAHINAQNTTLNDFIKQDIVSNNIERSVNAYVCTMEHTSPNTDAFVRIAGRLLECTILRNVISSQLQQRLLTTLEESLHRGLTASMEDSETVLIIARTLMKPLEFKPIELQQKHKNIIAYITSHVFKKNVIQGQNSFSALQKLYSERLGCMLAGCLLEFEQIVIESANSFAVCLNLNLLAIMLRNVYCIFDARVLVYSPYIFEDDYFVVVCNRCNKENTSECKFKTGNKLNCYEYVISSNIIQSAPKLPPALKSKLCRALLSDEQYNFVAQHLESFNIVAHDIFEMLATLNMNTINLNALCIVLPKIIGNDEKNLRKFAEILHLRIMESLRDCADNALMEIRKQVQHRLLQIIDCFASETLSEHWLFQYFKLTFYYMVHSESYVVHEAVLCAVNLCQQKGIEPTQLWDWYKRDALSLIVKLGVFVYLRKGVRLIRSLRAFTMMLGFSCVQEFVCKYYRLLVTILLPYCIKDSRCKGLLIGISKITRKPIASLFEASFLRIYAHICLTETPEICNRCIELIVKCTDCSLNKLMHADVKQTVAELLIYYNRNAEFVLRAFQCFLLHEPNSSTAISCSTSSNALTAITDKAPSKEFAKFIADRMLGVITYFETCLAEPNFEKALKREALESLGQIIRCIGPQHVTQFRFKIIAMLSFVLSLSDRQLQQICLNIWHTFLHIVDIHELGTSLSRIVASLEPLLQLNEREVNDIYEFIIVENASMLGAHIPDLYFVEDITMVRPAIRECVARQTELLLRSDRTSLLDKLAFYHRQITNEHPPVRIHGLRHLRQFINTNRVELHRMVLQQINVDPLFESTLNALLNGCRHEDQQSQVAAAKCLGELGAIDPTYLLKQNNASEPCMRNLPLGVITDEFAIMALTELCRAYQYQKDTKYVDNFSLAMQETLAVCGVSPREHKKMNVWQALPERMQQVMLPLLTSCYTSSRRETRCKEQPIFGSANFKRYEDWAFVWVSRLIDCVRGEEAKHLLNAYKPSMKRDNNTLALFLPYALLHALQEGTRQQVDNMISECQAVFDYSNAFMHNSDINRSTNFDETLKLVGIKEFPAYAHSKTAQEQSLRNPVTSSSIKHSYIGDVQLLEKNVRLCTKLCSESVDFLARWQREWQQQNSGALVIQALNTESEENSSTEPALFGYKRIQKFLNGMNKLKIAYANFYAGEFARALLYLEEFITDNANALDSLQNEIPFLIKIYGQLKEPDAVEGAAHVKQTSLDLSMEILVNRILDRPQDLMTCYEQLLSTVGAKNGESFSAQVVKGVLDCYLRLDAPETAALLLDGLWQACEEAYCDDLFKECNSEILWRLGRYDDLQELVNQSESHVKSNSWSVHRARAFMHYRAPNDSTNTKGFVDMLDDIRSHVLSEIRTNVGSSATAPSAIYAHSYGEVVKLQLLNDIEKCRFLACELQKNLLSDDTSVCLEEVRRFFIDWQMQLRVMQPLARIMEPVLCFRRNLLTEMEYFLRSNNCCDKRGFSELQNLIFRQESELWICSAQINRAAGLLQQAQLSLMQCQNNPPPTLELEQAQLLWLKGEQSATFKLLTAQLEKLETGCGHNIRELPPVERALYAEAKYLQATYNAEAANICAELNLRQFREAIAGNRQSEKCHVQLAQYMERIYDNLTPTQKGADHGRRLILDVMLNYAKSLRYGYENVYQSLPRLLGYWLDLSSHKGEDNISSSTTPCNSADAAHQEYVRKMNDLITSCTNFLPIALFYTAFSQLLSRICHPSMEVYNVLRVIVVKLIEHYPQQSLWMLLPLLKSSYANRIKRCQLILRDSSATNSTFSKLLTDFNTLAERLIELTNKEVTNVDSNYQMSILAPSLAKLFESSSFSSILLPFEKYMQASFPIATSGVSFKLSNTTAEEVSRLNIKMSLPTNPFPNKQLYIMSIDESVSVLRSAARPKKISFRCSDGQHYAVMVKPKDDLRKDFRLMEFNGLVKRYLHQDSDARQRCLRIRTYAAIPFNEECGLVEWLPRLNSFRSICTSIYRSRGLGMSDRQLRQYALPYTEPIDKKLKVFQDILRPRHPPVFHEWLRQRFFLPHSWYEARMAYVRTIAVMSMVGYILGLGDRHGENVLFDEINGDAVHVDFNCLFNQGELFAYPELVPFRLTHNMTFAMGPLGIEGVFRKSCEITLRLLKQEAQTLISVLRPFVYDLVVLTRKNNSNKKSAPGAELTDPKALQDVRRIEERLQGYVKRTSANSMPLSVEGQVNFLIEEATNINNLAAMYIGWGSYI